MGACCRPVPKLSGSLEALRGGCVWPWRVSAMKSVDMVPKFSQKKTQNPQFWHFSHIFSLESNISRVESQKSNGRSPGPAVTELPVDTALQRWRAGWASMGYFSKVSRCVFFVFYFFILFCFEWFFMFLFMMFHVCWCIAVHIQMIFFRTLFFLAFILIANLERVFRCFTNFWGRTHGWLPCSNFVWSIPITPSMRIGHRIPERIVTIPALSFSHKRSSPWTIQPRNVGTKLHICNVLCLGPNQYKDTIQKLWQCNPIHGQSCHAADESLLNETKLVSTLRTCQTKLAQTPYL